MKDIQSELGRLKKGIDEAKTELAKLEGREQELLRQLTSEHGLASIEAAEKEIEKLQTAKLLKEGEIRKDFDTLKETYEW